jgi:hypothetical protein
VTTGARGNKAQTWGSFPVPKTTRLGPLTCFRAPDLPANALTDVRVEGVLL